MRSSVQEYKKYVRRLFALHRVNGLIALKVNLLGHRFDDLNRCGTGSVLSASAYDHFNLVVKQSYIRTSKRLQHVQLALCKTGTLPCANRGFPLSAIIQGPSINRFQRD